MATEKSAAFNKALKTNLDKIVIATLLLILAGMAWFWYQEQNNSLGTESLTGRPAQLDNTLADNPALQQLQNMSPSPDISQSSATQRVASFNMFDYKTVETKAQIEQKAAADVNQAEQMIRAGQVEQARPVLQDIVARVASNRRAKELLDSITTPTVTATPAPTEPAVM